MTKRAAWSWDDVKGLDPEVKRVASGEEPDRIGWPPRNTITLEPDDETRAALDALAAACGLPPADLASAALRCGLALLVAVDRHARGSA